MEPERNIEKWLRAFAQKRRAAGGDFKLHPARRRQLQDEVARQFADEPAPEESVSLWQLFRQQWAMLAAFALVIFFVATMFAPALSKAKNKSRQVSAASQLKEIAAAAQIAAEDNNGKLPATLDELTNRLVSAKTLTDPASGKPFVYVAGGETLGELQSNSVLAYSPDDKKGRALLLADGTVQTVKEETFDAITRRGLILRTPPLGMAVNAPVPAAAPVLSAGALTVTGVAGSFGGGAADSFGLGVDRSNARPAADVAMALSGAGSLNGNAAVLAPKQFYFRTLNAAGAKLAAEHRDAVQFKLAASAPAQAPAVLASFELRQTSNAVQVVDADGSVYQGAWQPEITTAPAAPAVMPPLEKAKTSDADQLETSGALAGAPTFRVAGRNRTTKQNVVFTGTLTPLAASNAVPANSFYPARLTGTVTLDETNRIEINAEPATR